MGVQTSEISFESLEYNPYILTYDSSYLSENIKFGAAEFNKLYTQKIRLPEGRGNIIYLLSDTFENTIRLINSKNFYLPPTYRKLFYPWILIGSFMKRRYNINLIKSKKDRMKLLQSETNMRLYPSRQLTKSSDNIIFSTADIYSIVKPIMKHYNIQRNYMEFFKEFNSILQRYTPEIYKASNNKADNNRVLIIDADSFGFKMGAPLKENLTNPLFLIYLAFLRTRDLSKLNMDMDVLICSKNLFIKFNPSKISSDKWGVFQRALFRIMNVNLNDYTAQLTDDEKKQIDDSIESKLTDNIIDDVISPYIQLSSPEVKSTLSNIVKNAFTDKTKKIEQINSIIKHDQEEISKSINPDSQGIFKQSIQQTNLITSTNPFKSTMSDKREKLFKAINKDDDLTSDEEDIISEYEDDIKNDINEIIANDESILEEVMDDIQDNIAPLKNIKIAPLNSERDKKLREEQKKVVIKNSTIEEVLSRDSSNVPIESSNKSAVLSTTNENMKNITFANFDKTYIDNLYTKDVVSVLDSLKDKSSPFYITSIDVSDSSSILDLKETWTVRIADENGKKSTLKFDLPKFYDNKFMIINGNKYMIGKQNLYNPLVKDTPDTVILTTNYNKVTINRKSTKSLSTVEKIFSFLKSSKVDTSDIFISGDSSVGNRWYISTLEYDELSRQIFSYKSNSCEIYFSRDYIKDNLQNSIPNDIKGNEFYIGHENNIPILINEDTGLDRQGRTIANIIENNLSEDHKVFYNTIKEPKQPMYVQAKMAGQFLSVAGILVVWVGISKMLDKMGMKWQFHPDMKRAPINTPTTKYIKFSDGVLEYESFIYTELIMNGLEKLNPSTKKFNDFDIDIGYNDYIYSLWGSYRGIQELKNFYEFLIDPVTKDVCKDLLFPTEPDELLIHAVKLLSDNGCVSKASDQSYRVRSIEMIPCILYSLIARQYKAYINSGGRIPMTLKQRDVITYLVQEPTVEEYSTLNPAIEVAKSHNISTKGYKGSNSVHAYTDPAKRSYDPTSIGKLSQSTSPDANVGISRELTIEPTLRNARGYRDQVDDVDTLKDVNIFSCIEMLTPGTVRNDDPIRVAIAGKQSQHLVPVEDASPSLVSNGFDEAIQFHLSSDFVLNAEEDGQVIDINEDIGFIIVRYKSGKVQTINTNTEIVKNSNNGFYMSNKLKPTVTKIGEKFKKDEVLAYHDKYFKYSKMNGLRYAIGPLVKMAFMSSYNTYEDAGICTSKLSDRMKTSIVYMKEAGFKRNANIIQMAKIGDHVGIGDSLIKYDTSTEDDLISTYITKLSETNKAIFEEESKNDIKSNHAGTIVDIKVYTLLDPSNLSPSLGEIVQNYFNKGISKKEYLEKFDNSEGIMKAGYLLRDSTEPIVSRYNSIKGRKGIDVLIEIYIEHSDVMGVGDKIALYSANKQIVSEVIPEDYEPFSEFRDDEEISVITSPGTISRRMTSSVIPISAAMKVMVELKRKIKDEIKYTK